MYEIEEREREKKRMASCPAGAIEAVVLSQTRRSQCEISFVVLKKMTQLWKKGEKEREKSKAAAEEKGDTIALHT